jgi:hypothetical protein
MRASLWFVAAGLAVAFAAPAAQAQPGGSYLASCQNVQTSRGHDPQISASCKDMSGNWRFTTLRYRDCVGDIGNANGQLVCQGGDRVTTRRPVGASLSPVAASRPPAATCATAAAAIPS